LDSEVLLLVLQESTVGPCPESVESNPCPDHILYGWF